MPQAANRKNPQLPATARVMLIDDDSEFVEKLRYLVASHGFDCQAFSDPGLAVESIGAEHFDIVVTDLSMPGINGIKVIDKVKNISPDSVVIVVSGCLDRRAEQNAVRHGASLCLTKPLHFSALLAALSEYSPVKPNGKPGGGEDAA